MSNKIKSRLAVAEDKTPQREITLSDGRKALIRQGKGRDAREAMLKASGKQDRYLAELTAALVTIDDNPVFVEDMDELALSDYHQIQEAVMTLNFPSDQSK